MSPAFSESGKTMEDSAENSWIMRVRPETDTPTLEDNTGDVDRLLRGIKRKLHVEELSIGLPLVRRIPHLLRECGYEVQTLVHENQDGSWHLMDVYGARDKRAVLGLSVDIGSSTIGARLVDLESGRIQDEISVLNPQVKIGPDILTRIHYAGREGGLAELRDLVVECLNRVIRSFAEKHSFSLEEIAAMTIAGNTTMVHLFLGLDPYWICREPYIPVVNSPPLLRAAEIGIRIHPEAPVFVFPNVGSYFGGDLLAGILVSGMAKREELSILVDIGTNAEIVLGNKEWLVACAGAAGPALEGGVAGMGMMAGPGVIDRVRIDRVTGEVLTRTIQNEPAIGICGSGLIDLIAELYLTGMIDSRGRFVPEKCDRHLREMDGSRVFVVVSSGNSASGEDLILAQTDLDALLRSKAAMYAILATITGTVNISMEEIGSFYIAGTFGTYIDPQSAITIGMVPDLPLEKYQTLGNSSLEGATSVLLSWKAREEIDRIRDRITYLELNVNQDFMNLFNAARFIPHTDQSLFPSVQRQIARAKRMATKP